MALALQRVEAVWIDRFGVLENDLLEKTYIECGGDPRRETLYRATIDQAHDGRILSVAEVFAKRFNITPDEWVSRCRPEPRFDAQLMEYIAELRAHGIRVGMLTNSSRDIDTTEFEPYFDQVVASAHVGVSKPDVRIYQLAANLLGVPTSASVMVDDNPEYCMGASLAGMRAIHYTGFPGLVKSLTELLVPA